MAGRGAKSRRLLSSSEEEPEGDSKAQVLIPSNVCLFNLHQNPTEKVLAQAAPSVRTSKEPTFEEMTPSEDSHPSTAHDSPEEVPHLFFNNLRIVCRRGTTLIFQELNNCLHATQSPLIAIRRVS